ncbi:MAG: CoA transferase [Alphaproteobacteria bacterium]|nr:CoA transferase [Alphaproteobacteria bacterium]
MTLTGPADGAPTMAGVFVGLFNRALRQHRGARRPAGAARNRQGQVVEATLMDSALSMLTTAIGESKLFGIEQTRLGNRDRYLSPSHCFKSRDDKWVYVVAGNDHHFVCFCEAMGRPELSGDDRFSTFFARNANVAELEAIIDALGLEHDAQSILTALHAVGVPCEPVASIADVVDNPHLAHRGQIVNAHPAGGAVPCRPRRSRCRQRRPAFIAARRRWARIPARFWVTGSASATRNLPPSGKRIVCDAQCLSIERLRSPPKREARPGDTPSCRNTP